MNLKLSKKTTVTTGLGIILMLLGVLLLLKGNVKSPSIPDNLSAELAPVLDEKEEPRNIAE